MTKKRKNKLIMCEECNEWVAAIVYNYNYYCAECEQKIYEGKLKLNKNLYEGKLIEDSGLSRKIQ